MPDRKLQMDALVEGRSIGVLSLHESIRVNEFSGDEYFVDAEWAEWRFNSPISV